jgi:MOSC domain-containing protein YiiM
VAEIVSIVYKPAVIESKPPDHYARLPLARAALVAGRGIDGDVKGNGGKRQLNIMAAEDVAWLRAHGFRTGPGELGEQIVVAGVAPEAWAVGGRLRLGDSAVIEVCEPRTGCARFEHIQGHSRQEVEGRIGVMARVVQGGTIAIGDGVSAEPVPGRRCSAVS